jgi:hypothetical protein
MPLTCTYNNSTGRLVCTDAAGNTTVDQRGYSGTGAGRDNPAMEGVQNVGPIPSGNYNVGTGHDGGHTGPQTLNVDAAAGTDTHGRDAFRIHGNNARNDASQGCIIMPRNVRDAISNAGGATLRVTH